MSIFDKTPSEVALEMELAEVKRKLAYFEAKDRYEREPWAENPIEGGKLDLGTRIGDAPPRLVIPKTATIAAAEEAGMDIMVRAQTTPKEGKGIGQSYYISRLEAMSTRDQAQLLGYMHERFLKNLGGFLKDNR